MIWPTWSETAQLVTAIAAIGGWISSLINRSKIKKIKQQVVAVHNLTNSRMTELLSEVKVSSHAAGKAEGIKESNGSQDY